jgi:hypothetical protein
VDKFVITGVPGFDGEYPVDIGSFTMRELQIIKRMSGVRAGELEEAFGAGDSDLILAVAVIAVRRNGRLWETFEKLAWEADVASITFVGEDEEVAPAADPLTPPAPSGSSGGQQQLSSETSAGTSDEIPATSLRAIGSPG